MEALRLALRGLAARRGVAAVLLLVAAAAVAAACAGPLYLRAGQESLLRDELAQAPPDSTGISVVRATDDPAALGPLLAEVARVSGRLPAYDDPIGGIERDTTVLREDGEVVASTTLVHRQRACEHVVLVAGRCPSAPGDVMISTQAAQVTGASAGSRLPLARALGAGGAPVVATVTGVWAGRPTEPFWYGRDYFVALRGSGDGSAVDAVLTTAGTFDLLARGEEVRARGRARLAVLVDRPVRPAGATVEGVPLLRQRLAALTAELDRPGTVVRSYLPLRLQTAQQSGAALRRPVALVTGQLLLLAEFVLYTVVSGASAARGLEVALAKLRGFPPAATVAFALLETVLVLLAAVPLGLAAGYVAVRALAGAALGPSVPVAVTGPALLAALAALAGALVAGLFAAVRVMRRPVLDLLRRATSPRRNAATVAAEVAVLAAATAGLVPLLRPGRQPSTAALLAPGLLAVVGSLLVARLLPALCRSALPAPCGGSGCRRSSPYGRSPAARAGCGWCSSSARRSGWPPLRSSATRSSRPTAPTVRWPRPAPTGC